MDVLSYEGTVQLYLVDIEISTQQVDHGLSYVLRMEQREFVES